MQCTSKNETRYSTLTCIIIIGYLLFSVAMSEHLTNYNVFKVSHIGNLSQCVDVIMVRERKQYE